MSRKLLNDLDGFAVDEYAATFTGSMEVRGADARYLAYDDEVLLVVRARVKPPRLKELKNGDIVRVNVLGLKDGAVVRSDELKAHLCDTLGLEIPAPQLTLDDVLDIDQGASDETPGQGPEDHNFEELSTNNTDSDPTDVEVVQPPLEDVGPVVQKFAAETPKPEPGGDFRPVRVGGTKDARLAAFLAE